MKATKNQIISKSVNKKRRIGNIKQKSKQPQLINIISAEALKTSSDLMSKKKSDKYFFDNEQKKQETRARPDTVDTLIKIKKSMNIDMIYKNFYF